MHVLFDSMPNVKKNEKFDNPGEDNVRPRESLLDSLLLAEDNTGHGKREPRHNRNRLFPKALRQDTGNAADA